LSCVPACITCSEQQRNILLFMEHYTNVSEQYLPFNINEFDFRYNFRKVDDNERTIDTIKGFEDKRLYYQMSKK